MSSQEVLEYYLTAELLTEIPTVIHCSDYFSLKLDIVVYLFWILWLAGSSDVSDFKQVTAVEALLADTLLK